MPAVTKKPAADRRVGVSKRHFAKQLGVTDEEFNAMKKPRPDGRGYRGLIAWKEETVAKFVENERKRREATKNARAEAERQRFARAQAAEKKKAAKPPAPPEKLYAGWQFAEALGLKWADFTLWKAQGAIPAPMETREGRSYWPESVVNSTIKKLRRSPRN
jgi:hypothetical protein